jgi:GNAT superfamily N-acetyltransferase
MEIVYQTGIIPETAAIIEVYDSSGINRPTSDAERIRDMYGHSDLIITAWDRDKLVGISRALTDFCYCCYLSDLAVRLDYQKKGIGKKLIALTKQEAGERVTLILVAAPAAKDYYPKIGMERIEDGFLIKRSS